jgi:1-acyl-sn-glycerol-3-phosphate acyltransferase
MGIGLSIYSVLQVARVSFPTAVEALAGRVQRADCDARLRSFADQIIARARMQLAVDGADRVPTGRTHIYMSNHQSHIDIPVLFHTAPVTTIRMVAKTELFRIPVFSRAMRAAEFIEIDRSDRSRAVTDLQRAGELIRSGINVWIAPEGTRSRDGRLKPLKKGGFHLAVKTGTPIIPVALSGTRDVLPPGALRMRHDVPVRVVYGPEIPVEGRTVAELVEAVGDFLRQHLP